jgi:hypothetical protein
MDRETRAHLEAARDQIANILDPKFSAFTNSSSVMRIMAEDWLHWSGQIVVPEGSDVPETFTSQTGNCWPDYQIRP